MDREADGPDPKMTPATQKEGTRRQSRTSPPLGLDPGMGSSRGRKTKAVGPTRQKTEFTPGAATLTPNGVTDKDGGICRREASTCRKATLP